MTEVKQVRIFVITARAVAETGTVSFRFMFDALDREVPEQNEIQRAIIGYDYWGWLTLQPNGIERKRWNMNVFSSDGLKLGAGLDHTGETPDSAMVRLLSSDWDLDTVLLMDSRTADEFEASCTKANEKVEVIKFGRFDFDGCLSTS